MMQELEILPYVLNSCFGGLLDAGTIAPLAQRDDGR